MILTGKIALITGSTSGIGLGIATKLASMGATIALNGFGDADHIQTIVADLEKTSNAPVRYYPLISWSIMLAFNMSHPLKISQRINGMPLSRST